MIVFFKQKTAYEMRISDWSSDVYSSDLNPWTEKFGDGVAFLATTRPVHSFTTSRQDFEGGQSDPARPGALLSWDLGNRPAAASDDCCAALQVHLDIPANGATEVCFVLGQGDDLDRARELVHTWQDPANIEAAASACAAAWDRSEEHTSELQSPMRTSYAVFCLKKTKIHTNDNHSQFI